jgi:DNA-directed RNA polymerase subunit RPC12/RpoP
MSAIPSKYAAVFGTQTDAIGSSKWRTDHEGGEWDYEKFTMDGKDAWGIFKIGNDMEAGDMWECPKCGASVAVVGYFDMQGKPLKPQPIYHECRKIDNDMKRVCAWCGKDMGTKPSESTGTTHGMCPDCLKKEMGEMENIKTSAEKRNEAAAEGAQRWGSAKNPDDEKVRRSVRVHYSDGSISQTEINGTKQEVTDYFVGKTFTYEDQSTGKEKTKKAIKVDFF